MRRILSIACVAMASLLSHPSAFAQAKVEYTHYSDGSCTPSAGKQCVSKEAFQPICRKTSAWYNGVYRQVGVMDKLVSTLETNQGKSAFKNSSVYVSKGGDCMFKFDAVGMVSGTSYNRTYYCRVTTIEDDGLGKGDSFAVKSLDAFRCLND